MYKKKATQNERLLKLELDTLISVENQLREEIRKLALRACEVQRERIAKSEQLKMIAIYDA